MNKASRMKGSSPGVSDMWSPIVGGRLFIRISVIENIIYIDYIWILFHIISYHKHGWVMVSPERSLKILIGWNWSCWCWCCYWENQIKIVVTEFAITGVSKLFIVLQNRYVVVLQPVIFRLLAESHFWEIVDNATIHLLFSHNNSVQTLRFVNG